MRLRLSLVGVASFTDAWIETVSSALSELVDAVASFTDAWIETKETRHQYQRPRSHLLQMRGLKPVSMIARVAKALVASFTDAWIETAKRV